MTVVGKLQYSERGKAWMVSDLAPHAAIMFKRLFTKVRKTDTKIIIADNDDTRADLAWFMERYELSHDAADLLAEGVSNVKQRAIELERILSAEWTPDPLAGFRDGKTPYRYQEQAAALAMAKRSQLLGDDVGLGKTVSAITAAARGAPLPMAIVVEPHLAGQWSAKIREFSTFSVHVIKGTQPYVLPKVDIYVFRYSNVAGWVDVISKGLFKSVVWDEIQQLRTGQSTSKGQASIVLRDNAAFRMGLTATPVYNYGDEIFRVMEFIEPGLLGDWDEFYREWYVGGKVADPDALGSYLQSTGFYLRRREDDEVVNQSQPQPNTLVLPVTADMSEVEGQEALIRQLAQSVLHAGFAEAGQAARELDIRMRMMTGVAKARGVAALVRLLLADSRRILLAGWHREVYSIWREELAEFNPVLYTGTETTAGKGRSVEAFTTGDSRVMIISLRSGAGLDGLQYHCNDIVIGELDWSPQVHKQLIGRLRRPGQTEQVNAYYPVTDYGSDPVLVEMNGLKSDQARGITDPGLAPAAKFSDESRIKRLAAHALGIEPATILQFPTEERTE